MESLLGMGGGIIRETEGKKEERGESREATQTVRRKRERENRGKKNCQIVKIPG